MDNFTDFSSVNEAATGFVRMAVEEFNTHKNWTNLVERYWTIIDERLGGIIKNNRRIIRKNPFLIVFSNSIR